MEYHRPVMLQESIDGLNIKPDGIYVDVTFGGGGHSREILKRLGKKGLLLAFDQDDDAKNNIPDDKRLLFADNNFRFLRNFLRFYDIDKVDGILADLGVSSHHFDEAHRGFSFRFDERLDMRMNQKQKLTAEQIVNTYDVNALTKIFADYGEINNPGKLSRAIETLRGNSKIEFTGQL